MGILDLIPAGHENAVSREFLANIYMNQYGCRNIKTADRRVRKDISKASDDEHLIVNDGNGYFIYRDKDDLTYLKHYYKTEMAKGWSIINRMRKVKKFIDKIEKGMQVFSGQIDLFEWLKDKVVNT